jgi:insulysin
MSQDRTSGGIKIPQCDEREYRLVQLDNNLQTLLICDKTADKAAAALDVRVGHFSDPENVKFRLR